ncbi:MULTISPECIES: chromosome segregation protein SMC [unclassified Acinetobacter]|uniref:chromosome segregation protein SMC n=1 Tax=unclassified Acinetobacter TaxID=196816 RepID=UPI0029343F7F|nr:MULTISPECIES: chromosome segregation protein SMC [unclassified Acinetobacter]WOE30333.1 chromosome segregation protein SMC [Acinetobacter sp. SAAs470]WOE38524.1 chromosome segregation protein SMC [Acinetobacter sp. SAAs474]
MRLSSLKLSGFKSFADSTRLNFKANRTAVVGPNGCGKSNVIDAIRWVMGESSARQLRGGRMQDVIFTGTVKRKPVGMASVELRFENTYGTLGGAYNAYHELVIRRQVTREGASEYFLNGTKCRRRDITDIFLGTGLGPRSYAIIEQGMINRLVDAKPEEMRIFIEEAAGVSRYQARRRETMLHLEHTTQNLSRLEDIATELHSQLKILKKQAEAALQYQDLAVKIRTLKIEILSFQCQHSLDLQQQYTMQMNALNDTFKLVRVELHRVEHELVSTNALFQHLIEKSAPLQQQWQHAEKKQAELEITLKQKKNLQQQYIASIDDLEQQKNQGKQRLQFIEQQLEVLLQQQQQEIDAVQIQETQIQQQQQSDQLLTQQQQQIAAQFAHIKVKVEQQQQHKATLLSQQQQLLKNMARIEQQHQTIAQQIQHIDQYDQHQELAERQQEKVDLAAMIQQIEHHLQRESAQLSQLLEQQIQYQHHERNLKSDIQVLRAEQKNLHRLMVQISPSPHSESILLHHLKLKPQAKPYAHLIELFLAKWLTADILQSTENFQHDIARQLKLTAVTDTQVAMIAGLSCLADWIEQPVHSLWQQVAIATSLDQALLKQTQLIAGQSILTLDGYHVGIDWVIALQYDQLSQAAQGVLSHTIRLEEIEQQLSQLLIQQQQCQQQQQLLQPEIEQLQNNIQQQQDHFKVQQKAYQQLDLQLAKIHSTAQAFDLQKQQLQQQLQQLDVQLEEDAMQKDDLDIDLHALTIKLEQNLPEYQALQLQLAACNEKVAVAEQHSQALQQALHLQQRQQLQTVQHYELLEKDRSFLRVQCQQIQSQLEQSQQLLHPIQSELPELETQLVQQIQLTEHLQTTWQQWQLELNHVQQQQQQLTEQRQQQQQQDETLRTHLEEKRLAWQAAQSDVQHYLDQLKDMAADRITDLTLDLKIHQQHLAKAQQQFEKIGAVNLAASKEYEEVLKRYQELSHQMDDLKNTVTQLQSAMKSIDQETRKLFMTTFDQVNAELKLLFPKVFNGGEASLILEDDWQSGVKLMARPPGKRNSSLALLSGGEKALTALALVFAIFRLNPAPFCVLDEVDAPLDDANVGRFCNLVKELSEQVQFIYITHNKLAMTMATDLLGVTMPEPGTSKLVTVNLEEAVEYGLVAEA